MGLAYLGDLEMLKQIKYGFLRLDFPMAILERLLPGKSVLRSKFREMFRGPKFPGNVSRFEVPRNGSRSGVSGNVNIYIYIYMCVCLCVCVCVCVCVCLWASERREDARW